MYSIYLLNILLILHVIGGITGLVMGTISMVRKKGDAQHKTVGKLFYWGMLLAGLSSLALAIIHPNYFLFIVGLFTIYMVVTGRRYLQWKMQQKKHSPILIDYCLSYGMLAAAIAFTVLGVLQVLHKNNFGMVFIVFGILSLRMVSKDFQFYKGKVQQRNYWLIAHLQRMLGAYAAAATAFLVVNSIKGIPSFVQWLLPTAVIVPLIIKWTRHLKDKKNV